MGKISSGQNIAGQVTKQTLHGTKNNYIKKDKKPKFKNMPTGKVSLIDNVKAQNKNMSPQKNFQKHAGIKNNQHSPMEKLKQLEGKENSPKGKQNSPKGKQNFPKGKQNSSKGRQTSNKLQNKQGNKKTNLPSKKELEEMDDSDSDIDEGIVPQEEISMKDETFEDEESDSDVPDIFGASLAENSDIDDEDFEDEEEKDENEQGQNEEDEDEDSEEEDDDDSDVSEGKIAEQGGINMFRGIKSNIKGKGLKTSDDDEDDEDDEDEDDDEEEDEDEDEDEDDSDSDDEELNIDKSQVIACDREWLFSSGEDEDEDKDEDEESEEDEEEEEESITPGLKALLGKSMTDDDDDEDFNEEDEDDEDDDISEEEDDEDHDNSITSNVKDSPKKNEQNEKSLTPEEQEEMNKKTIFIDNIPRETKAGTLKKVFSKYGPIDNLRFRGIIPKNFKTPKKVAAIKQDIHPKAVTVTAYINYKSEESAKKALCMSGKKFEGNYINVQIVAEQNNHDIKKSVFIGNLKFGIGTNPIWECFNKCGEMVSVRLIRDKRTGQTRGFGYVNFKSEDAVALALKLNGTEIEKRPIRISPCKETEKLQKPRNKGMGKKRFLPNESNDNRSSKKFKKNSQKAVTRPTRDETKVKQKELRRDNASPEGKISKSFQGQKVEVKNKKKGNKFDKKKKEMARKFATKQKA